MSLATRCNMSLGRDCLGMWVSCRIGRSKATVLGQPFTPNTGMLYRVMVGLGAAGAGAYAQLSSGGVCHWQDSNQALCVALALSVSVWQAVAACTVAAPGQRLLTGHSVHCHCTGSQWHCDTGSLRLAGATGG